MPRDLEVLVAPLLECGVDVPTVGIACGLDRPMEVRGTLIQVRGGEARSAPEPPGDQLPELALCSFLLRRLLRDLEVSIVHMNGRSVRVTQVDDERDVCGEKGTEV